MSNLTLDNVKDWTSWQGPGPRYVENVPRKLVVQKKAKPKKAARPRSRSPSKTRRMNRDLGSEATLAYVRMVKRTFIEYPEVYNAFVRILSDIKDPGANVMELIEKVILLFDGYPDLILSFNSFLPQKYEIEIQDDAVVIRVYDTEEQSGLVETGTATVEFTESMAYIRNVKKTYAFAPAKYSKFLEILDKFHGKKVNEIGAIREVVELFKYYPGLVLGFNQFLPDNISIHMYDKSSYLIEHPGRNGKVMRSTIQM